MKKLMNIRKYLLLLLVSLSCVMLRGQAWVAPPEAATVTSYFTFTKETADKGKILFQKSCQSCHGIPGQNNPAKLVPAPEDPATPKFQAQKDGDIFWKITNGKTPMPQFMNVLSAEERWDVIAYLRTFNPKYVQPELATRAGFSGKNIRLYISYFSQQKKVRVIATELKKDKKNTAADGLEIQLTVERMFGDLPAGDPRTTDKAGIAMFDAPSFLPADRRGFMKVTARVNDPAGNLSESRVSAAFPMGLRNNAPSLIATRAWWSTRDKAPVWLIAVYGLALIIVWGLIFHILLSLRKVSRITS